MIEAGYCLSYIAEKIHTAVVATIDDSGLPVTSAIDIMDADESALYFLTAEGKGFCRRLRNNPFVSLTAIEGNSSLESVAVSVRGWVMELGKAPLDSLLRKNSYMYEIYPSDESRKALTVFRLYKGSGEWFDLSRKPIVRESFAFGGEEASEEGFFISPSCVGCEKCLSVCPQDSIDSSTVPFAIRQNHCLHCGRCSEVCPYGAVKRGSV